MTDLIRDLPFPDWLDHKQDGGIPRGQRYLRGHARWLVERDTGVSFAQSMSSSEQLNIHSFLSSLRTQ